MHVFYCDHFVLPLPDGHRFPMAMYSRLRERVATLDALGVRLTVPDPAGDHELKRAHHDEYVRRVTAGSLSPTEVRRIGFPWSPELVERSRRSVGGTLAAASRALETGASVNLAGGTHHAYGGHGEGFCVFNDVAVAILALRHQGRLQSAAVLDLDVHQGNGTAALFANDPSVFTLSVHGESNYPFRKETSDLDIALRDGSGDEDFLAAVERGVAQALLASPDLAFYIAGADPFEGDRLGRLAVSKEGLYQRDRIVFERCREAGIPVAVVMGGAYALEIEDAVDIHYHTVEEALRHHGGRSLCADTREFYA